MPPSHQIVQASHAAIAATHAFAEGQYHQPNLVVCGVDSEEKLAAAFNNLKDLKVPCCSYAEPDFGGQMTAVATAPLRGDERKPMRKFQLLK